MNDIMHTHLPWLIKTLSDGDPSSNSLKDHSLAKKLNQAQKSYTINTEESIKLGNQLSKQINAKL